MSWNNITPWWLIELNGVIARAKIHRNYLKALEELAAVNSDLPNNVYHYWVKRFNKEEFDDLH